jgi:protein-disulfide isomerase
MHDALFTHQDALGREALRAHARSLRIDVDRFTRELDEHRYLPNVRRDFREGVRSGVNGTPTMFINGARWDGPYTAEALLRGMRGDASMVVEPMTGLPWGGDA